MSIELDHCVIHVTDWERSNRFYRDVIGASVIDRRPGYAYRLGQRQLNVHGPGVEPHPVARDPVRPGNSDLCFRWPGPIETAVAHLGRQGIPVELGPVPRFGALGEGRSVYFRDPDGSLMELISYAEPEATAVSVTGTGVSLRLGDVAADEVSVVVQAFVELDVDGTPDRCEAPAQHGYRVSAERDATVELLRLVDEFHGDVMEALADLRIQGRKVSRWELMSAPRRIDLAPELRARLHPLRRG